MAHPSQKGIMTTSSLVKFNLSASSLTVLNAIVLRCSNRDALYHVKISELARNKLKKILQCLSEKFLKSPLSDSSTIGGNKYRIYRTVKTFTLNKENRTDNPKLNKIFDIKASKTI